MFSDQNELLNASIRLMERARLEPIETRRVLERLGVKFFWEGCGMGSAASDHALPAAAQSGNPLRM